MFSWNIKPPPLNTQNFYNSCWFTNEHLAVMSLRVIIKRYEAIRTIYAYLNCTNYILRIITTVVFLLFITNITLWAVFMRIWLLLWGTILLRVSIYVVKSVLLTFEVQFAGVRRRHRYDTVEWSIGNWHTTRCTTIGMLHTF